MEQKRIFIVHESGSFAFSFNTIYDPEKYKLYLITRNKNGVVLRPKDLKCFEKIIKLAQFSFSEIENSITSETNSTWSNVLLITHDEFNMATVAKLRDKYKISGATFDEIEPYTNKIKMKNSLMKRHILTPKFIKFNPIEFNNNPQNYCRSAIDELGLPVFVKKIDSAASDGVRKICTELELNDWMGKHSTEYNYEIDQFIDGDLYHIDSIIYKKKVIHTRASVNMYPTADFLNGKPTGTIPLLVTDEIFKKLIIFNETVLNTFESLIDGTTHLEVFIDKNNNIVFLEIAARSPGGNIPMVYRIDSNINFQEAFFKIQIGLEFKIEEKNGPYAAWAWFPFESGIIKKFNTPQIKSKYTLKWNSKVNEKVTKSDSIRARLGEIILENDNRKMLLKDFNYLKDNYQPCEYR